MKREHVKETAVAMVKEAGLINLSRRQLCERAGIPDGSFPHVMGCNFAEFVDELKVEGVEATAYPVNKTRANPELRKAHILAAAVAMAKDTGYHKLTRDAVAESAGVSMGLVTRYFGTMNQLKVAVVNHAVKCEVLPIVAEAIYSRDPRAKKISPELKARALAEFV